MEAVAELPDGIVFFTDMGNDRVLVEYEVYGLKPGKHGFHLHQKAADGRLDDCKKAGPHYNPTGMTHGGLRSDVRHAGDFGNIVARGDGVASGSFMARGFSVDDAIGRAVIVHEKVDDLGLGGDLESRTTGDAGPRLMCGTFREMPARKTKKMMRSAVSQKRSRTRRGDVVVHRHSSSVMFACEKMPLGNFVVSASIDGKMHSVRTKTYQICGSSQVMQSELCDKAMRTGSAEDAMRAVDFARLEDAFLMIELKQSCMGKKKATKSEIKKSEELSRKIGKLLGKVPMHHKIHLKAIADPLNSTAPAAGMTDEAKMCFFVR